MLGLSLDSEHPQNLFYILTYKSCDKVRLGGEVHPDRHLSLHPVRRRRWQARVPLSSEYYPPPLTHAYPLCIGSSSVLRQIHGINEQPQRAGYIRFSAWKLEQDDGISQFFGCIVAIKMELDGRPITEGHDSYTRFL